MLGNIDPAHIVLMMIPMILSLSFHEFAHALVARWLGDDTAQRQGRLTLNPVAHVDPIGTLLIPALGALTAVPLIGWAKPVPVNPTRFKSGVNMRRGYALVSAAGPISNLLLAFVSAGVLTFGGAAIAGNRGLSNLVQAMFLMNIGLCVFNLLPIAPLDGSKLLPRSLDGVQEKIAPYSMFILMGILLVGPVREILVNTPIRFLAELIARFFGLFASIGF
jgi:Zn-dependent protease